MPDDVFALLNRHVTVSRETVEKLSLYHDLLLKWQTKVNLVGKDSVADAWQRHFLDSLQLVNFIPDLTKNIIDFGSGAGFPGMVLAIAGATNIHLIESDAKKATFMKEVARITEIKVAIHHERIEKQSLKGAEILVSRALAPLDKLLSMTSSFISYETICLFHKGKNYSKEIEDAKENWLFESTIFPSVTDSQGVILKLTHLKGKAI